MPQAQPQRSAATFTLCRRHNHTLDAVPPLTMTGILIYHLAVSVFLFIVLFTVAVNWWIFVAPRPRRFNGEATLRAPLVSVMVPARNEAARIAPCLRSLGAQDYPNYELLVLDDHSQDDTAAVVLAHGFTREKCGPKRLLEGQPLPDGWTGKSWACHQLAAAAQGEYLVFTDADTAHDPAALGAFIGHAIDTGAGLLSAWPRQITGTWSERAVIPLVYVLLLGALPHYVLRRLQQRPEYARLVSPGTLGSLGAANGQYMLFRRDVYEEIGGHSAVRDHLVEDVALARQVTRRTAQGMRLINCDGSRLVECRMYTSFAQVWEGFTKNLRAAFSESAAAFWIFGFIQAAGLLFPFGWALVPSLSGRWWWLPVVQVGAIYSLRAALAARFRTSWLGALMHPLGHGLSLIIGLNSWRLSAQKGVTWKGRVYRMGDATQ